MVEGERFESGPGETVHVPKMAVHSGANLGEGPGKRILIFSPGGLDRFFIEAGGPSESKTADPADLMRLAGQHGWELA